MKNNKELLRWGKDNGLRTRYLKSGTGVMFNQKGETKSSFTIYFKNLSLGNSYEVAFNPAVNGMIEIYRELNNSYKAADVNRVHKWPRLGGMRDVDKFLLDLSKLIIKI